MTYIITPANNTFSNTCPLLVHYEATNNIVPTLTTNIVAGVYVARHRANATSPQRSPCNKFRQYEFISC